MLNKTRDQRKNPEATPSPADRKCKGRKVNKRGCAFQAGERTLGTRDGGEVGRARSGRWVSNDQVRKGREDGDPGRVRRGLLPHSRQVRQSPAQFSAGGHRLPPRRFPTHSHSLTATLSKKAGISPLSPR